MFPDGLTVLCGEIHPPNAMSVADRMLGITLGFFGLLPKAKIGSQDSG